jgi:hypothetical protein
MSESAREGTIHCSWPYWSCTHRVSGPGPRSLKCASGPPQQAKPFATLPEKALDVPRGAEQPNPTSSRSRQDAGGPDLGSGGPATFRSISLRLPVHAACRRVTRSGSCPSEVRIAKSAKADVVCTDEMQGFGSASFEKPQKIQQRCQLGDQPVTPVARPGSAARAKVCDMRAGAAGGTARACACRGAGEWWGWICRRKVAITSLLHQDFVLVG